MKINMNQSEFDKQVTENLWFEFDKRNLNTVNVFEKTGINDTTIRNYISRGKPSSPSFQNVVRIAYELDIPFSNILNKIIPISDKEKYGELTQPEIDLINAMRGIKPANMSSEDYEILKNNCESVRMILNKNNPTKK